MNSKSIGADLVYAWPETKIGMMDAELAAKIMYADASADVLAEKAKEYEKCPNCKNTYMIKMYNLKHYIFEDVAVLVDKVDSQI